MRGERLAGRVGLARRGAREDDRLAVGRPGGIAVHVVGVVGAGQAVHGAGRAVVVGEDAARGIEDLQEAVVQEVGDVDLLVERRHGVAAVGRDAREEAERVVVLGLLREVVPREHVLGTDLRRLGDGRHRVAALVAAGPVHVHGERLAVGGEGVAVGAAGHAGQEQAAVLVADVLESPADERHGVGTQGLDAALGAARGHERNVAVEDRRADRIARRGEGHRRPGEHGAWRGGAHALDQHGRGGVHRAALDLGPEGIGGPPAARAGLVGRGLVELVGRPHGVGVDRRGLRAGAVGEVLEDGTAVGREDPHPPAVGGLAAVHPQGGVVPQEARRGDLGREDRALGRVVDRDRVRRLRLQGLGQGGLRARPGDLLAAAGGEQEGRDEGEQGGGTNRAHGGPESTRQGSVRGLPGR